MKYYRLKNAVDTKETGSVYPQTDGLIGEETFSSENSYHKFSRLDLPEKFEPLETLKFAHSAKLSDFISNGGLLTGFGFIVSEKAKSTLEQLSIINHKFYKLPVQHKGKYITNYYWFKMFNPNNMNGIKWSQSKFYAKRISKDLGEVKLNSFDDYNNKKSEFKKYVAFVPEFLVSEKIEQDMFYLTFANTGIIVNETVKEKFENEGLTGYEMIEVEHIEFV